MLHAFILATLSIQVLLTAEVAYLVSIKRDLHTVMYAYVEMCGSDVSCLNLCVSHKQLHIQETKILCHGSNV